MSRTVAGVIAVGGDVPPELDSAALGRVRTALICHGVRDEWYTAEIFAKDVERLRAANVNVRPLDFEGGHEWSAGVTTAAAAFLREHHP
jgi:predicted esterase